MLSVFAAPTPPSQAHKWLLQARSGYFRALLAPGGMREGREGRAVVRDIKLPVFRAVLHYIYTDALPDGVRGPGGRVRRTGYVVTMGKLPERCRLGWRAFPLPPGVGAPGPAQPGATAPHHFAPRCHHVAFHGHALTVAGCSSVSRSHSRLRLLPASLRYGSLTFSHTH